MNRMNTSFLDCVLYAFVGVTLVRIGLSPCAPRFASCRQPPPPPPSHQLPAGRRARSVYGGQRDAHSRSTCRTHSEVAPVARPQQGIQLQATSVVLPHPVTMALRQHLVIASIFLLVALLQEGWSLSCYQCNSHNDTRCAMQEVPEDLAIPCPEDGKTYSLCRKIKQIIDFEVNGLPPDNRVIRSCGWDESNYKNRCYHRSGFGGRQEVCACDGDKCNGAGSLAGPVALLAAAAIATALRMAL